MILSVNQWADIFQIAGGSLPLNGFLCLIIFHKISADIAGKF